MFTCLWFGVQLKSQSIAYESFDLWIGVILTKAGQFQSNTPDVESHTCISVSCIGIWSGFVWLIPHQEKRLCCSGSSTEIYLADALTNCIWQSSRVEMTFICFCSWSNGSPCLLDKHWHTPSTGERTLFKLLLEPPECGSNCIVFLMNVFEDFNGHIGFHKLCY